MTADFAEQSATGREGLATRTFVQLADTLVADFDVVGVLTLLADRSVELVNASAAGIHFADSGRPLRAMAVSHSRLDVFELLQLQTVEGPSVDCVRNGNVVINSDLRAETPWPDFAEASVQRGFTSVCALPLRLRNSVLGCLHLLMDSPTALSEVDVTLAQGLADVASITIVKHEADRLATTRNVQLQHELDSRVVVEQAKGMIAEHESVSVDAAFLLIRRFARNNNASITETAGNLLERGLSFDSWAQPHDRRRE